MVKLGRERTRPNVGLRECRRGHRNAPESVVQGVVVLLEQQFIQLAQAVPGVQVEGFASSGGIHTSAMTRCVSHLSIREWWQV